MNLFQTNRCHYGWRERARTLLIVLAVLYVVSLAGCARDVVTVREPVPLAPPLALLEDCPEPLPFYTTNGELLDWALDLRASLRACNADKAALRLWRSSALEE